MKGEGFIKGSLLADEGACCMGSSAAGRHATVNGRRVLNMTSCDFLGIAGDPVIKVGPHPSRHLRYLSTESIAADNQGPFSLWCCCNRSVDVHNLHQYWKHYQSPGNAHPKASASASSGSLPHAAEFCISANTSAVVSTVDGGRCGGDIGQLN